MSKQRDRDNHANQLSPNNDAYWQSRGDDERPDDLKEHEEAEKDRGKGEPSRKK